MVPLDALFAGRAVEDGGLEGEAGSPAGLAGVVIPDDGAVANGLPQVVQVALNIICGYSFQQACRLPSHASHQPSRSANGMASNTHVV